MNNDTQQQIEWYKRTLPDGDPRDTAEGNAYLDLLDTMNFDTMLQAARRLDEQNLKAITPAQLVKLTGAELTDDTEAMAQQAIFQAFGLLRA